MGTDCHDCHYIENNCENRYLLYKITYLMPSGYYKWDYVGYSILKIKHNSFLFENMIINFHNLNSIKHILSLHFSNGYMTYYLNEMVGVSASALDSRRRLLTSIQTDLRGLIARAVADEISDTEFTTLVRLTIWWFLLRKKKTYHIWNNDWVHNDVSIHVTFQIKHCFV